ncbi:hypothetical protein DENSPDRAFT_792244 [Dentipellis sp. KUC8613]|nr:hypothetical protein DENSPDRAFT_792244 [Dentipellis sp. KUC8613]
MLPLILAALVGFVPLAHGHASIFHPSMFGFNVTDSTFPYDNRPVSPLMDMTFDQWWFHGHLQHPPNPGDIFELPAGQNVTTEIGCNKGATSFFASSEGGDIRSGDDVCPGSPMAEYHTTGFDDLKGCSLAIAYKSNASEVQPEDFTVFSINQTCVWTRFTDFAVPAKMPPCPEGGCTCAWFWIHGEDSGGEQNYMNGFRCNVTGSTSNVPLAEAQVPRRCGADPQRNKAEPAPGNCTYGAKQPFYWFQKERNNMFEGTYSPPFYLDLYNFLDGAQDDIFQDSYQLPMPTPSANQTILPRLSNGQPPKTPNANLTLANASASASASGAGGSTSAAPPPPGSSSQTLTSSVPPSPLSSAAATSSTAASSSLASSVPPPSSAATQSSSSSSAVVVSTVFVTVVAPASSTPTASVPASSAGISSQAQPTTIFLNSAAAVTANRAAATGVPLSNASSDVFALDAANVGNLFDSVDTDTDAGNATDTSNTAAPVAGAVSSSGMCKRNVKALDSTNAPVRRSVVARALGMGTYERHRRMHERGLAGLWHVW